jgi:hypothetical protein
MRLKPGTQRQFVELDENYYYEMNSIHGVDPMKGRSRRFL